MPPDGQRRRRAVLQLLLLLAGAASARRLKEAQQTPLQKVLSSYMSNESLLAHMKDYSARCAHMARLSTIGHSVKGVPLQVLELSDKPGVAEPEPNFKLIAAMHGTEPGGRQLLLALAEWLCAERGRNATAARVVNEMHLWLLPALNPDGYAAGTYENSNGVNLNRDFPGPLRDRPGVMAPPSGREQPETAAVMAWTLSRQFTAGANLHEGAFVVNYPWDNSPTGRDDYTATQDDGVFRYLASGYAARNPQLWASQEFQESHGITNGADWYTISGGLQDWSYARAGSFEMTLELWEHKGAAPLQQLFTDNLDAMLQLALRSTLGGVRGRVSRKGSGAPLQALVRVNGSSTVTRSSKQFGAFYRPLAPSPFPYVVRVSLPAAGGKREQVRTYRVRVPDDGSGAVVNAVFP